MIKFQLFLCIILVACWCDAQVIKLNGEQVERTFYGIGGLSGGGGNTRLLIDYEEPFRTQILDYLFKPSFGASLQILKVEIGGDGDSTDGTEASHMHTSTDLNYNRGYEWWLMEEAKKRNPDIILYALAWTMPGWVGNGHYFTEDNIYYVIQWLNGAREYHNLTINYVGVWNEHPYNTTWIKQFRQSLDAAGLQHILIVAADDCCGGRWDIVTDILKDSELNASVAFVGAHVAGTYSTPTDAQNLSQPLWSTEAHLVYSPALAACWAQTLNQNYVQGLMSSTIVWYLIDAFYEGVAYSYGGMMQAFSPWSGYYQVQPAIWVCAHTTQVTQPGWIYLAHGSGTGMLNPGSYVTLVPPSKSGDFSIIIETIDGTEETWCETQLTEGGKTYRDRIPLLSANVTQNVTFVLGPGLSQNSPLYVRYSQFFSADTYFVELPVIKPQNGEFKIELLPNSLYSITTLSTTARGEYPPPPPNQNFILPYKDNFDSYQVMGGLPKYFSDMTGVFEIYISASGVTTLRQSVPVPPYGWCDNSNPVSIIGSITYSDYAVNVSGLIESEEGFIAVGGRVPSGACNSVPQIGYWFTVNVGGKWTLTSGTTTLSSGTTTIESNTFYSLQLQLKGTTIMGDLNGVQLFSVQDKVYQTGFAAIGTGWHFAQFDEFALEAI